MRFFDLRTQSDSERVTLSTLQQTPPASGAASLDALIDAALPPFPLKVQLQTQTRCNAACSMCPYDDVARAPGFEHEQMSEGLFLKIIDELSAHPVERLSPFLMNEPLLDKRMERWLATARRALPGTTLNLFTNGSALDAKRAVRLAEAGLDELCVSVHGFDAVAYGSVMVGLSFERTLSALRGVVAAHVAGDLGALDLRIVTGDAPETGVMPPPDWLEPYVLRKGFSNERAVNTHVAALDPTDAPETRPLCQRPFVKLYVMADGECVMCNCDWRRRVVLGQLRVDSIAEVWRGEAYRILRRRHVQRAFDRGHPCFGCDYPAVVEP